MATINEMRQVATQIENETQVGGNTAIRVGGLFNDVVDKLEDQETTIDGNVTTIKMKRNTAAGFASANPVLADGELGFETDRRRYKMGDGVTSWNNLAYRSEELDAKPKQDSTSGVESGGVYADEVAIADYSSGVMGGDIIPNTTLVWARGVLNAATGAIVSSTKRCYTTVPTDGKMRRITAKSLTSSYYIHSVIEYSTSAIGTSSFVRAALSPDGTKPQSFSITTSNFVAVVVAKTSEADITAVEAENYNVIEQATDNLNVKGLNSLQGAGKIVDATIPAWIVGAIDVNGNNTASQYHVRSTWIRDVGKIELYAGDDLWIAAVEIYTSGGTHYETLVHGVSLESFKYTVGEGYMSRVCLKRRDGGTMTADMGFLLVANTVEHNSRIIKLEETARDIPVIMDMLTGGSEVQIPLYAGYYWRTMNWTKYAQTGYSCSDPYPVSFGQRIRVTLSVGGGAYGVWGCATSVFSSNGVALVSNNTEVTDLEITIPAGVNYIFISSRNTDFSPPFSPSAYTTTDSWLENKITGKVEELAVTNSLKGLKLVTLGDSITQGQVMDGSAPTKPFPVLVSEALGMDLINYGIGGSTIGTCANYGGTFASVADFNAATKDTSKYYVVMTGNQTYNDYYYNGSSWVTTSKAMRTPLVDRCDLMDANADVILIAGGTNDFQYNWADIGTLTDNITGTFYGDLNLLCSRLIARYPQKCIIFMTPIKRCQTQLASTSTADTTAHRGGSYGTIDSQNNFGKTLADYGNMIKEVCARYSIPVIDMYAESMLNPQLASQSSLFDSYKTHPYQAGHDMMARLIVGKLRGVLGFKF